MKVKNRQVVNFINGIVDIQEKKLPIKVGFAIAKNLKMLETVATAYEAERNKILEKYAEKDVDGKFVIQDNSYVIPDMKSYEKEMQELLEIKNELNLHTISYEELERCDTTQFDALSLQDISLLEFITE